MTFGEVIEAHALNGGSVMMHPDIFIIARPIIAAWSDDDVRNPFKVAGDDADCWHLWLVAGDASRAPALMPYHLPFISRYKREVFRVHDTDELIARMLIARIGKIRQ